jgi:hypothetical protein
VERLISKARLWSFDGQAARCWDEASNLSIVPISQLTSQTASNAIKFYIFLMAGFFLARW